MFDINKEYTARAPGSRFEARQAAQDVEGIKTITWSISATVGSASHTHAYARDGL